MIYIYPTDTVWGIGCSIYEKEKCNHIRKIKGNDKNKPLSVLFYNIDDVRNFFDLPVTVPATFFSLRTTLALTRNKLKKEIPEFVTGESEWVAVRCLPLVFLKNLPPITSTSLNLSGEKPVVTLEDAEQFTHHIKTEYSMIKNESIIPRGVSSSMIALKDNGEIEIWREGDNFKAVEKIINDFSS